MLLSEIVKDLHYGHWAFRPYDPQWHDDTFLTLEEGVFTYHCGAPGEISVITNYIVSAEDLIYDKWETIDPAEVLKNRALELEKDLIPYIEITSQIIFDRKNGYRLCLGNVEFIKFTAGDSQVVIEEYYYNTYHQVERLSQRWFQLMKSLKKYKANPLFFF
jgi:hypothetical protein